MSDYYGIDWDTFWNAFDYDSPGPEDWDDPIFSQVYTASFDETPALVRPLPGYSSEYRRRAFHNNRVAVVFIDNVGYAARIYDLRTLNIVSTIIDSSPPIFENDTFEYSGVALDDTYLFIAGTQTGGTKTIKQFNVSDGSFVRNITAPSGRDFVFDTWNEYESSLLKCNNGKLYVTTKSSVGTRVDGVTIYDEAAGTVSGSISLSDFATEYSLDIRTLSISESHVICGLCSKSSFSSVVVCYSLTSSSIQWYKTNSVIEASVWEITGPGSPYLDNRITVSHNSSSVFVSYPYRVDGYGVVVELGLSDGEAVRVFEDPSTPKDIGYGASLCSTDSTLVVGHPRYSAVEYGDRVGMAAAYDLASGEMTAEYYVQSGYGSEKFGTAVYQSADLLSVSTAVAIISFVAPETLPDWTLTDFKKRSIITIPASMVTGTPQDIVARVVIPTVFNSLDGAFADFANGFSVNSKAVVTSMDGAEVYPTSVVIDNHDGGSVNVLVFFRVPELSSTEDNKFILYHANDRPVTTFGHHEVWMPGRNMVRHNGTKSVRT